MCSGSGVPAGFGVMEIRRHVIEIQQLGRDQEFGQDQQPGDLSKNFTNLAGSACQCRVQFDAGSRTERGLAISRVPVARGDRGKSPAYAWVASPAPTVLPAHVAGPAGSGGLHR